MESKYEKCNRFVLNHLARLGKNYGLDDSTMACLDRMNKKVKGNNVFATSWTNKKGAMNKGRRFPKCSLAGLKREVRNVLAKPYYFDCDMENASYNALANIIAERRWSDDFPSIIEYTTDRENVLQCFMADKKTKRANAKEAFIKAAFGGDVKNWNDSFLTDVAQECRDLFAKLVSSGDKEMTKLHTCIIMDNTIKSSENRNIQGKFLANLTTNYERRELETVLEIISNLGYSYGATMNDGVFVELHRTKTPQEIVNEINKKYAVLRDDVAYPMSFKYKKFTEVLQLPDEVYDAKNYGSDPQMVEEYNTIKNEFEENHFKCIYESNYYTITQNKQLIASSKEQMKVSYENLNDWRGNCMTGSKQETNYLSNWFADPNMRSYDEIVFRPTNKALPANQFNSFMGFDIEQISRRYYEEEKSFTEEDIRDCEYILEHIRYLTDNGHATAEVCYNYLLNWLAQIFQDPENKPQTAIVIRSVAKGVGKNDFTYMLGRMIGNEYYNQSDNPERDLFGGFNDLFDKKILINLDEGDKKSTQKFYEELKAKITNDTSNIRKKFKSVNSNVRLYVNFIFTTNNDGVHIDVESRRFQLFECVNKKRSREDERWCAIRKALRDCEGGMVLFYRKLMERDVRHFDFSKTIETPFLMRAKRNCLSAPLEFLKTIFSYDSEVKTYKDGYSYITAQTLFGYYKDWCRNHNESYTQAKDFVEDLLKLPDQMILTKDQVNNQYLKTKKKTVFIHMNRWKQYLLTKNLIELDECELQSHSPINFLSDSETEEGLDL